MKKIFILLVMCFISFATWAYDVEIDGIYYNLNTTDMTAEVTYKGSTFYEIVSYSDTVVVPETITSNCVTYFVTSIGEKAFAWCTELTSVTIGNSVTNIGYMAFYSCMGLISVTIGGSVTSIEEEAFSDCESLPSLTIPNSVAYIGYNAFAGCNSLESISVESDNSTFDSRDNCNAIIESAYNTVVAGCKKTVIPNSVTKIGDGAFSDIRGMTSMTIPNSVVSIGSHAFEFCEDLAEVNIPNSVQEIGDSAFLWCLELKSIDIPNSVRTIGDNAFQNCQSLTSITIPESMTIIGRQVFLICVSLTSVTIPSSVTRIEIGAFHNCESLTSVYNYSTTPQTFGGWAFPDDLSNCTLYVPCGCKDAYQKASYWRKFKNIVEMDPSAVDNVNASSFADSPAQYYQINGTQSNNLQKGLNIIKTQDGVKKVLVK